MHFITVQQAEQGDKFHFLRGQKLDNLGKCASGQCKIAYRSPKPSIACKNRLAVGKICTSNSVGRGRSGKWSRTTWMAWATSSPARWGIYDVKIIAADDLNGPNVIHVWTVERMETMEWELEKSHVIFAVRSERWEFSWKLAIIEFGIFLIVSPSVHPITWNVE